MVAWVFLMVAPITVPTLLHVALLFLRYPEAAAEAHRLKALIAVNKCEFFASYGASLIARMKALPNAACI